MNTEQLGQIAYNAYCEARGWKSVKGDHLPFWKEQSEELREAWRKAAQAVADAIRDTQRNRTGMKTIYSPSNIEVLLHCHTCVEPHPRFDALAVRETIETFLRLGAITEERQAGVYTTTPLGKAWVAALCNTPPPKPAFVDEQGRVLPG